MVEYTYDWYRDFLGEIESLGRSFSGFSDKISDGDVILRHDVDWSPRRALTIAEIEAENDVQSTYFFLVTSLFYNTLNREVREIIAKIDDLGHDVGLHFSTHQYWDREPKEGALVERIETEQDILKTIVADPIHTIAFHNPPDWVLDRVFDGFASTYEPRYTQGMEYFADSLGRWRTDPPEIADGGEPVQVLTHPTLWGNSDQSPITRVRAEQTRLLRRMDEYMRDHSTLEWKVDSRESN